MQATRVVKLSRQFILKEFCRANNIGAPVYTVKKVVGPAYIASLLVNIPNSQGRMSKWPRRLTGPPSDSEHVAKEALADYTIGVIRYELKTEVGDLTYEMRTSHQARLPQWIEDIEAYQAISAVVTRNVDSACAGWWNTIQDIKKLTEECKNRSIICHNSDQLNPPYPELIREGVPVNTVAETLDKVAEATTKIYTQADSSYAVSRYLTIGHGIVGYYFTCNYNLVNCM